MKNAPSPTLKTDAVGVKTDAVGVKTDPVGVKTVPVGVKEASSQEAKGSKPKNGQVPRLNCATITNSQCLSTTWRTIIATDCPSACGFCNSGGCVDAVVDCANDRSICTTVGLQDFVNTYCQRTCNRCASSTTTRTLTSGTSTCTSYIADSSTNCANWKRNGFCTNTFYTLAQRRAYCATSCTIC